VSFLEKNFKELNEIIQPILNKHKEVYQVRIEYLEKNKKGDVLRKHFAIIRGC